MDSSQAPSPLTPLPCQHCGGECAPQTITITLRRSDVGFVVMRNVPAEVCQVCGEAQFSILTTGKLMASLQTTPDDVALIPIYDFAGAAS